MIIIIQPKVARAIRGIFLLSAVLFAHLPLLLLLHNRHLLLPLLLTEPVFSIKLFSIKLRKIRRTIPINLPRRTQHCFLPSPAIYQSNKKITVILIIIIDRVNSALLLHQLQLLHLHLHLHLFTLANLLQTCHPLR